MVCADDTLLTSLESGWVDVSQDSVTIQGEEVAVLERVKSKKLVSTLTLVQRQQRQQAAQLAFLKQQGLITEDHNVKKGLEKENCVNEKTVDGISTCLSPVESDSTDESEDMYAQVKNAARKAGVATAGGALVAVGAVLTPLPTPGGILLAGAGLGVLSTEFECAKKALDTGKEKLVDLIDSIPDMDNEEENSEKDGLELTKQASQDSEEDDFSVISSRSGISRSSSTVTQKSDVRASFQGQARRIGQSIRPFLTDEDAPRQAMETLNANTKRAYAEASDRLLDAGSKASDRLLDVGSKASGKLYDAVKFVLVLDEYDPNNLIPSVTSPLASPQPSFAESIHGPTTTSEERVESKATQTDPQAEITEDLNETGVQNTETTKDSISGPIVPVEALPAIADTTDSTKDRVGVEDKSTQTN